MNRSTTLRSLAAVAAALALGAGATRACADVIRLRTGETIKGRVVTERTNENVLTIEDYVTGTMREIAWDVLTQEDRDKHDPMGGTGFGGSLGVKCDLIAYRAGDRTEEVRGVVERDEGGFLFLRMRGSKEALRIDKTKVVSREADECDPTEIWPPEELAARMKTEIAPEDARAWYRLAIYCEKVQAFDAAKEAYEAAAADETFLNRAGAQSGAERMTRLLADKEALATLAGLRTNLSYNQFKSVRDGVEAFPTKHPSASEAAKKQLEDLKAQFDKKRATYFAAEAGKQFVPICKKLINERVRAKEAQINEVLGFTRSDLKEEAFAQLAKRLQERDPAVTPEEVPTFWENRPKRAAQWSLAKYGAGSFIIEPPTVKPSGGGSTPRPQPRGGGNSAPAPSIQIPKPPTRDGWWAKEGTVGRADWIFAHFVEKSGLFEVAPQRVKSNCDACGGAGLITKTLSNATQLSYLCPRCGGARYDLTVKYR
jgi:hypothetical protein